MKIISLFFFVMVFVSCSDIREKRNVNSDCLPDYEFQVNFFNCILIASHVKNGYPVPFRERANTFHCLDALTGHESHVHRNGDFPYLPIDVTNSDSFYEDNRVWCKWFEENMCRYTMEMADSVFEEYKLKITGDEVKWPSLYCLILKDTLQY